MVEHIVVPEQIILMRHGEAIGHPDQNLGLAPKGIKQVENVVDQWIAAGIQINHIRHSPKLRTMETALIAAKKTGVELTTVAASTAVVGTRALFTPALMGLDGAVLIVTHGPEVYGFLSARTDDQDGALVRPGEAFLIERNGKEWEPIGEFHTHKLKRVFLPR